MAGLLEGVKVLETAVLLAGDYLGMLLADEGAEVIKIETPWAGDYVRDYLGQLAPHYSPPHLVVNRNKKSVTLDLRRREGREIFDTLLERTDVYVTSNIGDTPRKLNLDYVSLRNQKPDIVYCQVTGFGADGPYANIPTHGGMMNALVAGTPPLEVGEDGLVKIGKSPGTGQPFGIVVGPLFAAYGIAAGLYQRCKTGVGCYIDVSCADAIAASDWFWNVQLLNRDRLIPESVATMWPGAEGPGGSEKGRPDQRTDDPNELASAKMSYYETKDGKFLLFCPQEHKFWQEWCRVVGRSDLSDHHDRNTPMDWGRDLSLKHEMQAIFRTRTLEEWIDIFRQHDLPGAPALTREEMADDPHLRHRQVLLVDEHPVAGEYVTVGNPVRVAGKKFHVRVPSPALGEHTDEILAAVGYSSSDIQELRAQNIV